MDVDLFDFDLPESLIAQNPLKERTHSRLLVLNKETGSMEHRRFTDFIEYLHPGDVLVLNNTRVIPARLYGIKKDTGAKAELLLLRNLGEDRWETLVRPAKRIRKGAVLWFGAERGDSTGGHFDAGELSVPLTGIVEEERDMGGRIVRFEYKGIFQEILDRLGQMPLPHYIRTRLDDKERYQTVYAKVEGSVAAPTAGLHFTEPYLRQIEQKGIHVRYITLHVGLGTFRPVSVSQVEDHRMHEEYFHFPQETADAIQTAKQNGKRVVAVGTTTVRTLETVARTHAGGPLAACSGWTDLFIYPGFTFQIVDAMLTNFHLPRSTLLMMISAFAGREKVLEAYREAVKQKYRFFSFGDAMFIHGGSDDH